MYPATYSMDEQANWKVTVLTAPAWSRHFVMAIIFNLLNVWQLVALARLDHSGMPYLSVFLIAIVFLYIMVGYYALALYRKTREHLKSLPDDSKEAQALLQVSYQGYRLYLTALFLGLMILGYSNLIRH